MQSLSDIIPILLDSEVLTLADIVNLSGVSKDLKCFIQDEEAYYWKRLFNNSVKMGEFYVDAVDQTIDDDDDVSVDEYGVRSRRSCFQKLDCRQNGLPTFFSTDMKPSITQQIGYYQLTKCLLSKSCHVCGTMGCYASPTTFRRYCGQQCANRDQSLQAKSDMSSSTRATLSSSKSPSYEYLLAEDETEHTTLNSTLGDSIHSQDVSNIFNQQINQSVSCYPIGVCTLVSSPHQNKKRKIKFTHALKCDHEGCAVSGNFHDIMLHKRLQHEIMFSPHDFKVLYTETKSRKRVKALLDSSYLKHKIKLSNIVKDSFITKSMGVSRKTSLGNIVVCENWAITFRNGCKIAIDVKSTLNTLSKYKIEKYEIDLSFQRKVNGVPIRILFLICDRLEDTYDEDFIHQQSLSTLRTCLSLDSESELIELLATLIQNALYPYILKCFTKKYRTNGENEHQKLRILKEIFGRRMKKIPIVHTICEACSDSIFKLQKSVKNYHVRRIVRCREC